MAMLAISVGLVHHMLLLVLEREEIRCAQLRK